MRGLAITVSKDKNDNWQARLKAAQLLGFDDFVLCASSLDAPIAAVLDAAASHGIRIRALRLSDSRHLGDDAKGRPGLSQLACPDQTVSSRSADAILSVLAGMQRSSLRTLILDAGRVSWPGSRALELSIKTAGDDGPEHLAPVLAKIQKERASRVDVHLEALIRSLFAIERGAEGLGIALTTPNSPLGVCLPEQMEIALTERPASRRGYWHFTCAARELERIGVVPEDVWLEKFAGRMVGVMLSDSIGGEGGQAPGLGEVDFRRVKPYLRPETAKIMTVADDKSGFKLQFGRDHLSQVGIF